MELVGAFDGRAQDGSAEAVEVAAAGVENEKALSGEDLRIKIGEGLGQGAAGLVGGDERVGCVRWAEQLGCAFDDWGDAVVQDKAADWAGGGRFAGQDVFEIFEGAACWEGDVVDFVEVVVFSG